MDTRRCNSESCKVAVAKRSAVLDAPLVTILDNPVKDWQRLAYGSVRIAKRVIDVDWKKFNQDNYVMAHCFAPDTKILMVDGTERPIQDIRVGDEVVTHLGRTRKVTAVMSRAVDEEMVEIKPASLPPTLVTKEHPFAVIREGESWCKHNREWQKCIYGLSKRCSTWGCKTNGAEPQFVFAGELKKGDRTFTPSLGLVRESGFTVESMRLLGYYVAEGRVDHDCRPGEQDSVRFSIAREESGTIGADICRLMGLCFSVYSHGEFSNPDAGGYTLSFASNEAAKWFLRHAGCGSKIKRLSAEVMYSSPDIQKELLLGWAAGDGEFNESKRLLRISTSSPCLASQGEVLIDRIGGLAIVHKMTNAGGPKNRAKKGIIWQICVKHSNMGMMQNQFSSAAYNRWPRTGQRYRHAACVVSEITSIKSVPYKGLVFNFSVCEDESYIANRCAVHNCSIVCSVRVEDNGFYIDPVCSELVNNNGNAWSNEVLLSTFRTFIGADNFCFIEGTRILMADGTYKEIQNVKVGDKVINRKGVVDTVKNTGKRWSDSLVKISSTDIMCRDLFVTSEHPFWVFHARENCPKTGRPNNFNRDKDFYHLDSWLGFSVGVHRARGEIFPCGLTPQWKEAGQLDANRDFLTHPVSDVETPIADINENRAELIGWFLAEGCYAHTNSSSDEDSGVVFNLGNDEQDVAERIRGLLWTEFSQFVTRPDCQVRIEETESGSLNVRLSNREVARFFYEWCGKWAWAKKLNEKALWLPKKLQALILKHCINGDGTGELEFRGYSLEMKSQSLIQQLLFIAWRLDLNPTYRETGVLPRYTECEVVDGYEVFTEPATGKKSRPGYGLWFTVRNSMALNAVCGHIDERIASRQEMAHSYAFDSADGKWLVAKIEGFEKISVGAFVYNIEVENDNSYVAEGVVVHNCEHVQIPELSKGKILDAVIRPVTHKNKIGSADVYWVDILVGTARKHTDLVKRITSGELTTLSMGCSANQVQCSKCGIVLTDDDKNCEHLDNEMLQYFNDENGVRRIVAELCGKSLIKDGKRVGDPKSVQFIEASWVERPAFTGAVLNHYISEVPKLSSIMGFNHARLAECVEDLFKLRVADVQGMTVLRVARAEWIRRQREATIEKVARSLYLGK